MSFSSDAQKCRFSKTDFHRHIIHQNDPQTLSFRRSPMCSKTGFILVCSFLSKKGKGVTNIMRTEQTFVGARSFGVIFKLPNLRREREYL